MVTIDEDTEHDVGKAEGGAGAPEAPAADGSTKVEVPEARRALVQEWTKRIKASREHHGPAFERMRKCMKLAAHGTMETADAESENGNYVVPITNRLINVAVASLYAKDPTMVAKPKEKLLYQLWDGDPATLAAAQQAIAAPTIVADPATGQAVAQPDPNAAALLEEVMAVKQQLLMQNRLAKTTKLLFAHFLNEQASGYKELFKALVRRAKVCGVGYVDLGFQRALQRDPDVDKRIEDATSQVKTIEAKLACMQEKPEEYEAESANAEELRLLIQDLQSKVEIIVREGPVLGFPKATQVIIDKKCRHLKTFAGARWIALEFDMDVEEIQEVWGKNVKAAHTAYKKGSAAPGSADTDTHGRVWVVQDKKNQQTFAVCDGHPDFLKEPAEPDVKIERFWTIFPLVINEIESEDELYPPSDVWNARHMQQEFNSSAQGRREHKIAARPRWASIKGKLEDEDRKALGTAAPFSVTELNSLTPGEKVADVLGVIPVPGIDPNLYETETTFQNIQRVVGVQEANFGGTSNSTATEASIAENSLSIGKSSDVDDLDTMLAQLARGMGQLMLLELSKETVVEICGPGAVWPDTPPTREQIVKDLVLDIEAGSSGRPNKAQDLANFERAAPWIVQLPGIRPDVIAKKPLQALDIDLEEALVEGLPSITAMNSMAKPQQATPAGGDPKKDPNQQGDKGGDNAPNPQTNEPQSQPAFPTGAMVFDRTGKRMQ